MDDNKFTNGDMVVCQEIPNNNQSNLIELGGVYKLKSASRYFVLIECHWYNYNYFELLSDYRIRVMNEILS